MPRSVRALDASFFTSPIGLGHAARDAAVAQELAGSIQFITGGGATELLAGCGFDAVDHYDPPAFDVRNGALHGRLAWLLRYYSYYRRSRRVASSIIKSSRPRLVISDEDFASLSVAQEESIPNVLITDILETRFLHGIGSAVERWMNHSMNAIISRCDVVIVPEHGPDYGNVRRVGPIVREISSSREDLRRRFGFNGKTILISVGGTGTGRFLIEKVLDLLEKLRPEHEVVLASGPALQGEFGDKIRDLGFVKNLHEAVFASDLVISLAGRSTMDEARAYGTPGIFIPIKGHFEQEANAKSAGFSHKDLDSLYALIVQKIGAQRSPVRADGSRRACAIINNLFKNADPGAHC